MRALTGTAAVASIPGIRVVDEPRKGLVIARETGRRVSTGDVLVYVDADCRAPRDWLERVAQEFDGPNPPVAVTGPYRFYDWDLVGPDPRPDVRLQPRSGDARARAVRVRRRRRAVRRKLRRHARGARTRSAASIRRSSFTAKIRTSRAACRKPAACA